MTSKTILYKILPFAAIIGLAFLLYGNTLHAPFQYDDHFFIKNNNEIRDLTNIKAIWTTMAQPTRFVTFFTFAVNYHFHELNVFGYHLTNVFIHILTGMCVWWLARQLMAVFFQRALSKEEELVAIFSSLLFLSHPAHTQAISYLSQRFASLAALFYLSSVCCYIQGRVTQSKYRPLFYFLSVLTGILGMFTKEIVITLPFMILFIEFFLLNPHLNPQKKSLTKYHWGFILFVLSFIVIIPIAFKGTVMSILFSERISESHLGDIYHFHTYQFTQWRVFVRFIFILLFPANLIVNYDFPMSHSPFELKTISSLIFLIAILAFAFRIRKKQPLIAFGIFWFFITLSANLVPRRHAIFEHKLYLVSIGPCIAFCYFLFKQTKNKQLFISLLLIIISILSFLTINRNKIWQNEILLWEETEKNAPQKLQVINNLGKVYLDAKMEDKAFIQFEKALKLSPDYVSALNNRGFIYKERKQYDLAIQDFTRAIYKHPRTTDVLVNRGDTYKEMKQYDKAYADYAKAVEIKPEYGPAYNSRGRLYAEEKKYNLAIPDFLKAIEINSFNGPAHNNLGLAYKLTNQFDKALQYLNRAIEIKPNNPDYIINRANVYEQQRKYELALVDYNRVIELDPNHLKGYNNRGVLYGKSGMLDEGYSDLIKALELDPNYSEAHSNLGLIYKHQGKLDEAIREFDKAIKLNPEYGSAYYNRGLTFMLKNNNAQALMDFKKAQAFGRPINPKLLQQVSPQE